MNNPTLFMVGLPESGKTTYLTALFHLLRSGVENGAGLKMEALPEDRDYFMEAEASWLRFESLSRTALPVPGRLSVPLSAGDSSAKLSVPDLRGEDFERLWEYGTPSDHLLESARDATGTLLFVRADSVVTPPFLDQTRDVVELNEFALEDWPAENAPTQTKLCDILEQLGSAHDDAPIAVVVSAWDTVTQTEEPAAWFQRRLPLLWQYLETGATQFAVFGVSAQGGDLEDPDQLRSLASLARSTDRIADPEQRRGADLTDPIAWLLREQP